MNEDTTVNRTRTLRFLDELNNSNSPTNLDIRGENAFGVAVKFLTLVERAIPDPEDRKKLVGAWFKAVRDGDYKKFRRVLRKITTQKDT